MTTLRNVALVGVTTVLLAACGGDDDSPTSSAESDARVIDIDMVDTAFEPDTLEVASGDTIRFVFTNTGAVAHDAFNGDDEQQADHDDEMRDAEDSHGGGHSDGDTDNAVTVEPGDTAELTYTFAEPGTLEIGCHQPGHYEAGMVLAVDVA